MKLKNHPRSLSPQEVHQLVGRDDPVILEIGCNDGVDTQKFLDEFGPKLQLYCFECDPRPISQFRAKISDPRCQLWEYAISETDGTAPFHQSSGTTKGAHKENWDLSGSLRKPTYHLVRSPWCKFETTIRVDTLTLDSFLDQKPSIDRLDFAWIDAQGAESSIIRGGRTAFRMLRYAYLECPAKPEYEGQLKLDELLALLGPRWVPLSLWEGYNVLCQNIDPQVTRA